MDPLPPVSAAMPAPGHLPETAPHDGDDDVFVIETAPHDSRVGFAATCVEAFEILCRYNSATTDADDRENLTAFHCVAEPPISLQRYLGRLATQAEWDPEGVLLALRLAGRFSQFTGMPLTVLLAHRLVAVAGIMALKAHSDRFRSNRTVARVAGMHLPEVNGLELEAFKGLGYSAVVYEHEVQHMLDRSALAVAAFRTGLADQAAQLAETAFCGEAPAPRTHDPRAFVRGGRAASSMVSGAAEGRPYHELDARRFGGVAEATPASLWGASNTDGQGSATVPSTAAPSVAGGYPAEDVHHPSAQRTTAWYDAVPAIAGGGPLAQLPPAVPCDENSMGEALSQTATSIAVMNNRLHHRTMPLWHPQHTLGDESMSMSAAPSSVAPSTGKSGLR
uniref:Uncharacterized protein n=1 Tax=Neobodo designis TaxID=312471 RepID=A0A7S1W8A1_NEODS|mmetsp:Transcript_67/g.240  ORF Transcript_67/g.240 Transcript_67/m.240 type:complete len:392 (+) Transcript_67:523-1698(+)